MDFHEKAKQLKTALNRLHVAKMAHKSANKVYNDAKVWRYNAEPEDYHGEQKSLQNLRESACEVKSIEAEIRRIKLARITEHGHPQIQHVGFSRGAFTLA